MMMKITIQDMHKIATERGGNCLSLDYVNSGDKLEWQCNEGHIWEALLGNIKKGKWCPVCAGNKKMTISEMYGIAVDHGGKCLSENYINATTKLKWQCKNGHTWEATPGKIKQGQWCPRCIGKGKTIEDMKTMAIARGGKCLSNVYVNSNTKLKWQCGDGHIWETTSDNIRIGHWCPECAGVKKPTISEMIAVANDRGGKCLSSEYANSHTKIRWQCKNGHTWEATPTSIKRGTWCPICMQGVSERVCKKYFEIIFGKKFPKVRPEWLRNSNGVKMELDGFCNELNLAFEYQGRQHYQADFFHPNAESLQKRIDDDKLKANLCKENKVYLIIIPYTVKINNIYKNIIDQCQKKKINIPAHNKIDYRELGIYDPGKFGELQKIAIGHGGKCLSDSYVDSSSKLRWQCDEGHTWEATPSKIKQGQWCPKCAGKEKLTIGEMQKIAIDRGGKCLSKQYVNVITRLKWQCKEGHVWEAIPLGIKKGNWCPVCAGKAKLTIEEMKNIASNRNGKCLSIEYLGNKNNLKWQCKEGHIWEATPHSIKSGSWCARCAGVIKPTLEQINTLVRERGGVCLSATYINAHTPMTWKCNKGHLWEATFNRIQQGSWCAKCKGNKKLTIGEMEAIAVKRGGKCLSTEYIGCKNRLLWRCKQGHTWQATPGCINQGQWCPICAKGNRTKTRMAKKI